MAKIFTQQFEAHSIDILKLGELAKLIINELTFDCTIFERIKGVKFIPSYFCTQAHLVNLKVFNPIVLKKANIYIQNTYFKEHLDFVWTINDILPDYCRNVKGLKMLDTPSCSVVVNNFIEILKRCSNEQFFKKLNQKETQ